MSLDFAVFIALANFAVVASVLLGRFSVLYSERVLARVGIDCGQQRKPHYPSSLEGTVKPPFGQLGFPYADRITVIARDSTKIEAVSTILSSAGDGISLLANKIDMN